MNENLNDIDFLPQKTGFDIPENYFESLEGKISRKIKTISPNLSVKNRLKPYLLIAASFAALFIIWQAVLSPLENSNPSQKNQNISYLDLQINDMDDETIILVATNEDEPEVSDNDIINYLSNSSIDDLINISDLK